MKDTCYGVSKTPEMTVWLHGGTDIWPHNQYVPVLQLQHNGCDAITEKIISSFLHNHFRPPSPNMKQLHIEKIPDCPLISYLTGSHGLTLTGLRHRLSELLIPGEAQTGPHRSWELSRVVGELTHPSAWSANVMMPRCVAPKVHRAARAVSSRTSSHPICNYIYI